MRARRALLFFTFTCAVLAGVGIAETDARADGDAEGAKKHFEAGRKLRDENDCIKAIPEFEKSLGADRSIGAYYNLGFCLEQLGKRQEAYDAYRRGRDMASTKKDERLKEISGSLAALLETPNIRLVLPQPLPPGFNLTVDGEAVAPELYQGETVIFTKSAATHEVRATAVGYDDTVLKIETKQLKSIEMKQPGAPALATAPAPPVKTHWTWERWTGAGLFIGGIGIGSVGAIMGIVYKVDVDATEQRATSAAHACTTEGTAFACNNLQPTPPDKTLPPEKQRLKDDFQHKAATNNNRDQLGRDQVPIMITLGVVGAVAAGIGVYLFVTNPPEPDAPKPDSKAGAKSKPGKPENPVFLPILSPTMTGGSFGFTF